MEDAKRTVLLVTVAIALFLCSCSVKTGNSDASTVQTSAGAPRFTKFDSDGNERQETDVRIIRDNQTGVQYLLYTYGSSNATMVPLLNADGSLCLDPEVGE